MSRLGARYKHFWNKGFTYRHFWAGTESTSTGNGSVLTVTTSLIPGAASGTKSVTASGSTMTVTPSLINGMVSVNRLSARYRHFGNRYRKYRHFWAQFENSGGPTNVAGVLFSVNTSFLSGAASAIKNPTAAGATLTITGTLQSSGHVNVTTRTITPAVTTTSSLIAGHAGVSPAPVNGATLTSTASLIAGSVFVDDRANGTTNFPTLVSLIPGTAHGDGNTVGFVYPYITLEVRTNFPPAFAEINPAPVSGATKTVTLSFIEGTATGGQAASASGTSYTIDTSIISGDATGGFGPTLDGELYTISTEIIGGTASGVANAEVSGAELTVTVSFDGGIAFNVEPGDGVALGSILEVDTSLVSGQTLVETGGSLNEITISLEQGTATGEVNATGQIVTVGVSVVPGHAAGTSAPPDRVQAPAGFYTRKREPQVINAVAKGATLTLRAGIVRGRATGTVVVERDGERPTLRIDSPAAVEIVGDRSVGAVTQKTDISCFTKLLEGTASVDYTDRNRMDDAFVLEYVI